MMFNVSPEELERVVDETHAPKNKPWAMAEKGREALSPGRTSGETPAYRKAETPGDCYLKPERDTVRLGIEGQF